MADRQIFELTAREASLSDVIAIQQEDGDTEAGKNTVQELKDLLIPLEYRAILSQTSTNAPTVVVINNTLSGAIVWTYNSIGNYSGTLNGAFTVNKTLVTPMNVSQPVADKVAYIFQASADVITILSRLISDDSFADIGVAQFTDLTILVYP